MRKRDRGRTTATAEDPKDVEALERVLEALDGESPASWTRTAGSCTPSSERWT